jgi:hypothetical protein
MTNSIPSIIFQTSKERPPNYLVHMIKNMCPGWTYIHFTDDDIIRFFKNNYLNEFPNIIEKFHSIKNGAHKADLFRYYFIYIKGGVFLDSDAMIQKNINTLLSDYDFFSVESTHYCPSCIFQGFLGAKPNNKIIYEALCHAYNVNIESLNKDYLLICRTLFNILKKKWNYKIKIYKEIYGSDEVAITIDDKNNSLILAHYQLKKIVPCEYFNINHIKKPKKYTMKHKININF